MLAPATICMTASENIHSIAPQGRVELPVVPNKLMQIQHNFLSRGFQGGDCGCGCGCESYTGSGLGQIDLSTVIGGFSVQTLLLMGAGAVILYYILFSSPGAKQRRVRTGERKLTTERSKYQKRIAAIEKRYGVRRREYDIERGEGGKFQRAEA